MFGFDFDGMPGSRRGGPKKEVDNSKFYTTLGIPKDSQQDAIKKAFRRQAMEHHPDKGGDPEKFKEIQKAYEVLSDPEKRKIYDQYGEEAATQGGPSSSPGDIFSELFGGGGGSRGPRGPRRGDDTVFPLQVDLEALYRGDTKKLKLTKRVLCKGCGGKGGKADAVQPCAGCKGRGVKVVIRQLGPGMIQQMQTSCPDCKGEGSIMADKDKCKDCRGEKTVAEEKILEVAIERGMKHGDKIKFSGEGDQMPDIEPGDVICVLQQRPHALFKRDGPHLILKKKITLLEALTGFQFTIKQLDGRTLVVASEPGVVYKPGDVKGIESEGMPMHRQPFKKGMLFIELELEFPKSNTISDSDRKVLAKILPPPPHPPVDPHKIPDAETVHLMDVDVQAERQRAAQEEAGHSGQAYDEDAEPQGAGPQCRTQ